MEVTLGNDTYSKDVIVDYGNQKGQSVSFEYKLY